jgi:mRNA interferase MazF
MKQGEIWLLNLDPTVGAEMNKTRPAVIVNDDQLGKLPLKIIAPITDWKDHYSVVPWMVAINPSNQNGLVKKCAIDCFQIRSVSKDRLIKRIGHVSNYEILHVQEGILKVIGYDS